MNIKQLFKEVETNIISMYWTDNNRYGDDASLSNEIGELRSTKINVMPVESNKCQGEKIEKCKKTTITRKTPITKSNEFLW
jgi:hypothetical protein